MEFKFAATGVGSVPGVRVERTCRLILELFPEIPFWPQFVNLTPLEDMILQFSEGLPGMRISEEGTSLRVSTETLEDDLTLFYEKFLAEDLDAFALGPDHAHGLYTLLDLIEEKPSSGEGLIKGQSVGPITFASSVLLEDGRYLLHEPDLMDAMVKGLSIKLVWQAKILARTGRRPILFIDEPALSGIGSAFSSIDRDQVVKALREVMDYCRARSNALLGVHCCANTDWPMILESGPDILNFDAYGYLDALLLYPQALLRFVEGGGTIAWGIVPTMEYSGDITAESLQERLEQGVERMAGQGIDRELLRARSMVTSACGMGSMPTHSAEEALRLLSKLEKLLH